MRFVEVLGLARTHVLHLLSAGAIVNMWWGDLNGTRRDAVAMRHAFSCRLSGSRVWSHIDDGHRLHN